MSIVVDMEDFTTETSSYCSTFILPYYALSEEQD